MPVRMDTHGRDWKQIVRRSRVFLALCLPAWADDPFPQQQLAYARKLGKDIYFLVPWGTPAPPFEPNEHVRFFRDVPDCARIIVAIEQGAPG